MVIIDKPTDTFIEQVQTGTVHRFFWKGVQKVNCLTVYNEQSDRLLDRRLSVGDKAHDLQPTIQQQGQPISIVRQQT
jgi:hypothetical protein